MRIYYGSDSNRIDITHMCNGILDLTSRPYNSVFGDPHILSKKMLYIDDERSGETITIDEDTPISICNIYNSTRIYVVCANRSPSLDISSLIDISDTIHIVSSRYIRYIPNTTISLSYTDVLHRSLEKIWEIVQNDRECIILYIGCDISPRNWKRDISIFGIFPSVDRIVYDIDTPIVWMRSSSISYLDRPSTGDIYQWIGRSNNTYIHNPTPYIGSISKEKYILIDINHELFCGLTNQLLTICVMLLLGSVSKRNIVVTGFYPNYNKPDTVHIGELIDIDKYNTYLSTIGTSILDIRDIPGVRWVDIDRYHETCSIQDTCNKIGGYPYIRLPIYSLNFCRFTQLPEPYLVESLLNIQRNMVFNNELVSGSNDRDYIAAHIRIEDDMLKHLSTYVHGFDERSYVLDIYNKIRDICLSQNKPVYIATGLGKYPNKYNHILETLKLELDVIPTSSLGRGREFDAARDMFICTNSPIFIGGGREDNGIIYTTISTFPSFIANIVKHRGGRVILI